MTSPWQGLSNSWENRRSLLEVAGHLLELSYLRQGDDLNLALARERAICWKKANSYDKVPRSILLTSASDSFTSTALIESSRLDILLAPGMGTIQGDLARSHARTI